MAGEKWVLLESKFCDLIGMDVELQERRVFPASLLPDLVPFRRVARRCTAAIECNMAGVPCSWAYNNPGLDRFPES